MSDSLNKKTIIEQSKRLSQSAIWRMQRDYFDKEGIQAWVSHVPFYITSNPFIAHCYAKLMLAFIIDWTKQHPESVKHPFYIMELGTGSGRFSYYFVKTLMELLQTLKMDQVRICYVMTDFTENNMKYWKEHPALKPYVDKGIIDFALYNMETEAPIQLVQKNIKLSPKVLVNPLTVFANYIFDTISQDAFTVRDGTLYELLLSLSTDEKTKESPQMEQIAIDYDIKEIKGNYYEDPHLNTILKEYKNKLKETSLLFPIGSFRALSFLKKLAKDRLFIVATDKGYNSLESLDHLGHPAILFHGSFSLMVNFHALAEYFKLSGGDAALQSVRKGIKTSVFSSGFKLADLPATTLAIEEQVHGLSPGDYFILHTRMSEAFQECGLATLAAHMQLTHWDPHMYLKLANYIISRVDQEDKETIHFLIDNMDKMAKNYYYMPQSPCVLFEIGIFFHAVKHYEQALQYYLQAQPYIGEQFSFYYNLALCHYHLDQNALALDYFKEALALDPRSKEAEQWIDFLTK